MENNLPQDSILAHRLLMEMFHHFNRELFGSLPLPTEELILTIECKGEKMNGCFEVGHFTTIDQVDEYKTKVTDLAGRKAAHDAIQEEKVLTSGGKRNRFKDEKAEKEINSLRIPRIVMNAIYNARELKDVCSTLVHEMVHYWQWKWGARYPKSATHNQEWSDKMISIGLTPVCEVTKNGKTTIEKTGRKCHHEIVDGGPFDRAFQKLPESIKMPWAAIKFSAGAKRKCNKKNYACSCSPPVTFQTTKKVTKIKCGHCDTEFVRVLSEDEEIDEAEALEVQREREERLKQIKAKFEKSNPNNWGAGQRGENTDLDDLFALDVTSEPEPEAVPPPVTAPQEDMLMTYEPPATCTPTAAPQDDPLDLYAAHKPTDDPCHPVLSPSEDLFGEGL